MINVARLPAIACSVLAGCATAPLPTYEWVDEPTAINIMRQRAESMTALTAECRILLHRDDGESIHLDGVMLLAPPAAARIRAWKIGRPVFDLLLRDDRLWFAMGDGEDSVEEARFLGLSPRALADAISLIIAQAITRDSTAVEITSDHMILERPNWQDVLILRGEIDRASLIPRRYSVVDASGVERYQLMLEDYAMVDGHVVPTRIWGTGDSGRFILHLSGIEVNGALEMAAFVPPSGAVEVPP
jgi:hypothetical protein